MLSNIGVGVAVLCAAFLAWVRGDVLVRLALSGVAAAMGFVSLYVAIYRRIARFQVPRWLVAGARRLGHR